MSKIMQRIQEAELKKLQDFYKELRKREQQRQALLEERKELLKTINKQAADIVMLNQEYINISRRVAFYVEENMRLRENSCDLTNSRLLR